MPTQATPVSAANATAPAAARGRSRASASRLPVSRGNLVPLSAEPIARGLIEFLGGARGRHAQGLRSPLGIILGVAYLFTGFAFLAKANCAGGIVGDNGVVNLNWNGNRQFVSACYNDIIPLYSGRGLDKPGFVYAFSWQEGDLTRYMEYPVLAGLFQGLVGFIARSTYGLVSWIHVGGFGIPEAGWYFGLTALVMAIIWIITLIMVSELLGNRQWDLLLLAASPLLVMHGFTNWDIPSIAFGVAAMLAAKRGKFAWAGAFMGLGAAFKLWPIFLLGAYLTLAVRKRKFTGFGIMLAASVVAWLVVNIPIKLLYPEAWAEFFRLNSTRGWEWTTVYALISRNLPIPLPPEVVNAVSLMGFLAACLLIFVFGIRVKRQPRVAELVYLILVAFLMCNKVWSPQYSLWLLVPAVLALPYWRLLLSWMLADALVWPVLMWHMLGDDKKGVPHELLDLAILARDGFILAIAFLVIRQMLGLVEDKVAAAHDGADPLLPAEGGIGKLAKKTVA